MPFGKGHMGTWEARSGKCKWKAKYIRSTQVCCGSRWRQAQGGTVRDGRCRGEGQVVRLPVKTWAFRLETGRRRRAPSREVSIDFLWVLSSLVLWGQRRSRKETKKARTVSIQALSTKVIADGNGMRSGSAWVQRRTPAGTAEGSVRVPGARQTLRIPRGVSLSRWGQDKFR